MSASPHPLVTVGRLARMGAAAVMLCALVAATAAPAGAQTPPSTTSTVAPARSDDALDATDSDAAEGAGDPESERSGTTTTVPAAGGSADVAALEALLPALTPITDAATMDDLRGRYGSLSAALVVMYAAQTGTPLDEFVATNADSLAAALGADRPAAAAIGQSRPLDAMSLTTALASSGIAADLRSAGSLEGYTRSLSENADSLDARVVAAGSEWARQLAELRTPSLATPSAPSLGSGGPEALAVGLFANRAATAMVTDFPDLFSQVRSSGVGTPAAAAAWRTSMRNAMAATEADFSSAMPNPCYGALMTAMASGDASAARSRAGGCGSCVATGLYLNGQMSRLFDPKVATTQTNPFDNLLPPAEFNQLQPWQRQAIGNSRGGQLGQSLSSTLGGGAGGCSGGSAARDAAGTILPGVFSQLSRP